MLYSIGYQGLRDANALIQILKKNDINTLVDVRSKPYSRVKAFHRKQLDKALRDADIHYIWKGQSLGGFSEITESDIEWLAKWQVDKTVCLMCMEADPNHCHRKWAIAERLKRYHVMVKHLEIHV